MIRKLSLVVAVMCSIIAPRSAEPETNLDGIWTITVQDGECEFGGQAAVRGSDIDVRFVADLTLRHACPTFPDDGFVVIQTSEISVMNGQVSVRSKIVDFATTESWGVYAPDHFALTIKSAERLFGIQTDRYGTKPAEWVRSKAGVS
mgnify:FL=1